MGFTSIRRTRQGAIQIRLGSTRGTILAVAVAVGLAALGFAAGSLTGDEAASDADPSADARARVARLEAERDRLLVERNQLEARLAAEDGARVCPDEYVSTGSLLPLYSVDYPCGWHVLFDPSSPVSTEDRDGLRAEVLLLARLPISLAPRGGPAADLELVDWTDDPNDDTDMLPPVSEWLAEERERFTKITTQDRFEAGDGITVHRLIGEQDLFDEPVTVHVLLWRYDDAINGVRHIARAFALDPGRAARDALERLVRSFTVLTPTSNG